jgi:hypothetical protein
MASDPTAPTSPTLLGRLGRLPADEGAWAEFAERYGRQAPRLGVGPRRPSTGPGGGFPAKRF